MEKKDPSVDLLLITLALAGGHVRGKTRLQKLAYLVWKKLHDESTKKKLPKDIARILNIAPKAGPYGGLIMELQDRAPRTASALGLIEWLRPVNASESFELTKQGWQTAKRILMKIETLGIDLNGKIKELAQIPLNELLLLAYEESLPEHLTASRIKNRMANNSLAIFGEPSPETLSIIEDLEKEGYVEKDEKYMRIGECEELEPGLKLCVKQGRKRPYFQLIIDSRLFDIPDKNTST